MIHSYYVIMYVVEKGDCLGSLFFISARHMKLRVSGASGWRENDIEGR